MASKVLSTLALRLKNGNPEAFDSFIVELDKYASGLVNDLLASSPAEILAAQGRVQSVHVLLRVLKECHLEPKKPPAPQ